MSIEPVHTEADELDAEEAAQERAFERRRQLVAEDARKSDIDLTNPWSWFLAGLVLSLTIFACAT